MENNIILYTINCPKCKVLEKKLEQKEIPFVICTDIEIMKSKNIKTAPYLEIDGELFDFNSAVKWLRSI